MSAADPAAAVATCSPVAGSITGMVAPSSDGTASPSTTWPNSGRSSCRAAAVEIGYVEGSVRTLIAKAPLSLSLLGASPHHLTLLRFRLWPSRMAVKRNDVTSIDEFLDISSSLSSNAAQPKVTSVPEERDGHRGHGAK